MDILFLSPADWNGARGRFHHIAERLARHNRVLYVDGLGVRTPLPRDWKRIAMRITRLVAGAARPARVDGELFRMSPVLKIVCLPLRSISLSLLWVALVTRMPVE